MTESPRPRKYWNALKTKLEKERSKVSQSLGQLKMKAQDGKIRLTDIADAETLLRIIQFVPSKKVAKMRGRNSRKCKKNIEKKTGKKVISAKNVASMRKPYQELLQ